MNDANRRPHAEDLLTEAFITNVRDDRVDLQRLATRVGMDT